MSDMGRPKSIHKNLPPRMIARKMAKGRYLYYYNGKKRIPLGDDLNIARMEWAKIEAGNNIAPQTFKAIAERYRLEVLPKKAESTRKNQDNQLDRLIAVFGKSNINDIRHMHIRQYLDKRSAKREANREVALLSHVWNKAKQWGYTDKENPCTGVDKNPEPPRNIYVSDAEFSAVLAKADEPLKDAMLLAYHTGQRLADVLKMTRQDIRDGALWVRQNKTGKMIAVELTGELKSVVNAILVRPRAATSVYLVQTNEGRRLTYAMLRNRFDDAREAAGAKFQFRDIRPKAATDSGSLQEAQALLGHESSATTKRHYRHIERVKPVGKTGT